MEEPEAIFLDELFKNYKKNNLLYYNKILKPNNHGREKWQTMELVMTAKKLERAGQQQLEPGIEPHNHTKLKR